MKFWKLNPEARNVVNVTNVVVVVVFVILVYTFAFDMVFDFGITPTLLRLFVTILRSPTVLSPTVSSWASIAATTNAVVAVVSVGLRLDSVHQCVSE